MRTVPNLPLTMSSEADEEGIDLFQEPADFYEPEKQASFASHRLLSGQDLTVRLVGHNPLWVSYFTPHYHRLQQPSTRHNSRLRVLRVFFACSRRSLEAFNSRVLGLIYSMQGCKTTTGTGLRD